MDGNSRLRPNEREYFVEITRFSKWSDGECLERKKISRAAGPRDGHLVRRVW